MRGTLMYAYRDVRCRMKHGSTCPHHPAYHGRKAGGSGGGTAAATNQLDSLTGLRALAAFVVFVYHAIPLTSGFAQAVFDAIAAHGAMGVSFFFMLSGFVLTWAWSDTDRPSAFFRRRFARIYPAYFVALLGGVVVTIASGLAVGEIALPFVAAALLLQSWVPSERYYFAVNGPSWSLSCEAFFYTTFPFIIRPLIGLSTSKRRALQVGLLIFIVAAPTVAQLMTPETADWFVRRLPPVRLAEFLLGITVALDVRQGHWRGMKMAYALPLVLVGYVIARPLLGLYSDVAIPAVPFLALLVAGAWADLDGRGSFFSRPIMVRAGEISYCFYLVHQLVIRAEDPLGLGGGVAGSAFRVVLALVVSIVGAWLLHMVIERPLYSRLKGRRAPIPVTLQH